MLVGLVMTGCAANQPAMPVDITPPPDEGSAAALVFDVPITLDQAPIDLSRSNHGPAAFVGFDDSSTTYYDIVTDNRQSTDCGDQFARESLSERVGTSHR
jgi:hypothetical protein